MLVAPLTLALLAAPLSRVAAAAAPTPPMPQVIAVDEAIFGPPEWTPAGPVSIPDPTPGYRWDPPTSRRVAWLVTAWFALVSPSLIWLIVRPADALSAAVGAGIVLSTVAWARLLTPRESRPASPRCAGTPLAR